MAGKFEQVGLEARFKNFSQFMGQLGKYNKGIQNTAKTAKSTTGEAKGLTKSLGGLGKTLQGFVKGATGSSQAADILGGSMGGLGKVFDGVNLSMGATVGVAAAVGAAFIALGVRGANLRGIEDSFQNIARAAGFTADVLRDDLSTAAAGTISDFELMRQTNIALAGASGEVAQEFGESLPKLLEVARVQARATGQSVDFLFESLVTGIKRSSPAIIDNTGLVLSIGEAQEKYAASIGKTTEELTKEEQQLALIAATVEASDRAIQAAGNVHETAAEKMSRAQATISNTLDDLAVAVQPVFELLLDIVNGILSAIAAVAAPIIQVIEGVAIAIQKSVGVISQILGAVLTPVVNVVNGVLGFLANIATEFLKGGAAIIGALATGIAFAANTFVLPVVEGVAKLIADFLVGLSPPPKGPLSKIDKGGENVMKAWLDGFARTNLDPIERVTGEVSQMMQSVANLSRAEVESRLRALDTALEPFSQRLDIVQAQLEAIKGPAESAVAAIDRQQEKALELLSQGDAQAAQTVRALDAQRESIMALVDAKQEQADAANLQLVLAKAAQAEERSLLELRLKGLPALKQTESAYKGIAKAASKAGGKAVKPPKGTGGAASSTKPLSGASDATVTPLDPTAEVVGEGGGSFFGSLGDQVTESFLTPLVGSGELQRFQENVGGIQEQAGRIQDAFDKGIGSNFVGGLESAFSGLGGTLDTMFVQPFSESITKVVDFFTKSEQPGTLAHGLATLGEKVGEWLAGAANWIKANLVTPFREGVAKVVTWFTDPATEGTLAYTLSNIGSSIGTWLSGAANWIKTNLVTPFREGVGRVVAWFTDPATEGSLAYTLSNMGISMGMWLTDAANWIKTNLVTPFVQGISRVVAWFTDSTTSGTLAYALSNLGTSFATWLAGAGEWITTNLVTPISEGIASIVGWFTDVEQEGSLAYTLANMFTGLSEVIEDPGAWISENIIAPISTGLSGILDLFDPTKEGSIAYGLVQFFVGAEEGSLSWILSSGVQFFQKIPKAIGDALQQVGTFIWNAMAVPLINILNWAIDRINDFLRFVNDSFEGFDDFLQSIGISPTNIAIGYIQNISVTPPSFLTGGATGGVFSGGSMLVGERGTEVVTSAEKLAVFPHEFVTGMDMLSRVMLDLTRAVVDNSSGGATVINDNSIAANFNGSGSAPQDDLTRLAMLRAMR